MSKLTTRQLLAEMGIQTRSQQVDLTGSNNMFGSIAGNSLIDRFFSGMDFIPEGPTGKTISITGEGVDVSPKWKGLQNKEMQFWAYNYCPPLSTVIDRTAEADTNGIPQFVDEDGQILKKEYIRKVPKLLRIKKLFNKPNPIQTREEFNSQQLFYCKTFGYFPVLCISPFGMDKSWTKYMFNINPVYANPVINENYDIYAEKDSVNSNPILEWTITIHGKKYTIPASDIILIKDGYMEKVDGKGLPLSKVAGLDYSVSNICAAMEADNVLLKKKGPLGVFSHDSKPDLAGMVPMTTQGQDDLQDQLRRYGLTLGQLQYVVSKYPVKWNAMSFNLRDLMTKETVKQGTDIICDRFGFPAELMSGKDAKYENRKESEKFWYQTVIIPFSLRRTAIYNDFFNLEETPYTLFMSFEHLPILQEDVTKASQAREAYSNSIQIDWEGGRISYNESRILQKLEPRQGYDDVYYPEYLKLHPEMALTGNQKGATDKTKYDRKITKKDAPKDSSTKK